MGKIEINKNWLYSMKGKKMVGVYELVPRTDDILKYKRQCMKTIPRGRRLLYAVSNYEQLLDTIGDSVTLHDINYGIVGKGNYHLFAFDNPKREGNVLKKYYNGDFDDGRVIKVFKHEGGTMHLLPTEDYEVSYKNDQPQFKISNVLSIPSDLAILQSILQGNYQCINNFQYGDDIDGEGLPEILSLFDLEQEAEIPLSTFEYPFTTDSPEKVRERIKDWESTYQKIKDIREGNRRISVH